LVSVYAYNIIVVVYISTGSRAFAPDAATAAPDATVPDATVPDATVPDAATTDATATDVISVLFSNI
jgi:hypothetical protein